MSKKIISDVQITNAQQNFMVFHLYLSIIIKKISENYYKFMQIFVMIYQYFVLQKIYQFQNMKFHDGILSFVNKCQTKF